eukprot:6633169-Lingulodinium_polyedra.AAC.1
MSLESDGVSPHPSLGEVSRRPSAKGEAKARAAPKAMPSASTAAGKPEVPAKDTTGGPPPAEPPIEGEASAGAAEEPAA